MRVADWVDAVAAILAANQVGCSGLSGLGFAGISVVVRSVLTEICDARDVGCYGIGRPRGTACWRDWRARETCGRRCWKVVAYSGRSLEPYDFT